MLLTARSSESDGVGGGGVNARFEKGDGRWHDSEQRVRFVEHKIQRQASEPISGLMLLGEQVDNATTK
jgi:hypothetical protein